MHDNTGNEVLTARNLIKRFGALVACNNISYALRQNEVASIIGPNGAGKTTFFNLITGLYQPDSGHVFFQGRDVTRSSPQSKVRLGIVRTFQLSSTFDNLRVIDNFRVACYLKQRQCRVSVLGMCLTNLARVQDEAMDRIMEALDFKKLAYSEVSKLSLGDKRRLEIAMAIIGEPKVLLLDEPFAGLSEMEIGSIVEVLKEQCVRKMSILIIEHKITWLKGLVDRVSVLVDGRIIVDGTYEDALDSVETRKSYWKIG
ncbi:MAG: ABC transporter ATP-binding protein [Bacillota bacterium]